VVVNCVTLKDNPQETFDNLYKFLYIQHYKENILFPYNFSVSVSTMEPFYFCISEFFNSNKKWLYIILQKSLDTNCDKL
jgi:hypothetical protein